MTRPLIVKVTCGVEDAERLNQAFTVAAAAVSAGAEVSLWLTGEASWLGVADRDVDLDLPLSVPMGDLRAAILEAGSLTVCSQCAARRLIGERDVLPGVRIAGAAVFVEEVLRADAQALVY